MRKIKFRAWCPVEKKMIYVGGMVFDGDNPTLIQSIGENYKEDYEHEVIWLQYIGRVDKHYKEYLKKI